MPDSLGARVLALLLGGLILFYIGSLWIYQNGLVTLIGFERDERLAERFVAIRRSIAELAVPERDRAAHALSGAGLDVHWAPQSLVGSVSGEELYPALRSRLRAGLSDVADDQIRIGYLDEGLTAGKTANDPARHVLLVSVQLSDGSWVNGAAPQVRPLAFSERNVLFSASAMGLGVVIVAVILARLLTAPLKTLADAAQRLGVGGQMEPLPESGPREVRIAARAFNQMQARVRRLMDDRTQTLAAVSHDLKTPITRLRLRAEFVSDPETNQKIAEDLDEMERMIDATLAFLRDDISQEQPRVTDIAALLQTVCNDEVDTGHDVAYDGPARATLLCRGPAVKRAIANVVGNAVKYGGCALVTLSERPDALVVTVSDRGPGIPLEEQERVFEPFHRLDTSRNVDTGGHGLGLTFARTVIRAHGGDVRLANRPEGGLRVTVTLPKIGAAAES